MRPRQRVLCVEPFADISAWLCQALLANGFHPDTASTAAEAIEKAAAFDHCLYLVCDDCVDGTKAELIRRLRRAAPGVPVLVYSTGTFRKEREEESAAGARVFLPKPGDVGELVETISRLCRAA